VSRPSKRLLSEGIHIGKKMAVYATDFFHFLEDTAIKWPKSKMSDERINLFASSSKSNFMSDLRALDSSNFCASILYDIFGNINA